MAVVAIREALEEGRGPSDPGGFIARLASGLTERMDPVIAELADEVDALEETSLLDTRGLRGDLAEIRRTTIVLRRYVGPQRDALAQLSSAETRLLGPHQRVELREVSDRITRMVEELDGVRDRSAILNDQLADQRAEDMNATMLVLSVVAAIFLPLGFLTGLLGINVGGMPGANTGYAFWVVVALCAGLGGGLAWMFRRRGWI
jgi:zinc transporter